MRSLKHQRIPLNAKYLPSSLNQKRSYPCPKHGTGPSAIFRTVRDIVSSAIDWHEMERALRARRVVCMVNFAIMAVLIWQFSSIARLRGDSNILVSVLRKKQITDLPYPLRMARAATHSGGMDTGEEQVLAKIGGPGYVSIRAGTFRNKYPSITISGGGTFDAVYVITSGRCERQWDAFRYLATSYALPLVKWELMDARRISLAAPPVPIASDATMHFSHSNNRALASILKRQIAYMDAHQRLWRQVIDTGKQRVLVIDDTLFPTQRLLRSLPPTMSNIDTESVARRTPWHFIFLRRQGLLASASRDVHSKRQENVWTLNPKYKHAITIANVSHGVGAYILSLDGAKYLSKNIVSFRAPLDVEIGLIQLEHRENFVALSACNNDVPTPFCPEMILDISKKGMTSFDCGWRRTQEAQTAGNFDKFITADKLS